MAIFKIHKPNISGVFNGAFNSPQTDLSDGIGQEVNKFLLGVLKEVGLFFLSLAAVSIEKTSKKMAADLIETKLGQQIFGRVVNSEWQNTRKIKGLQNEVNGLTSEEFALNFDVKKLKKIMNKHGLKDYTVTLEREKARYVVHYAARDQELFERCVKKHYSSFSNIFLSFSTVS